MLLRALLLISAIAVMQFSICLSEMSPDLIEKINGGISGGTEMIDFISSLGSPKNQKVFDSIGKMAGFLGAAGGLLSFALLFVSGESEELSFMKQEFAKVNMKLDQITTELDNIKSLIKYENQISVYIGSASKILHGHQKLLQFLNEIQRTHCSTKNSCKQIRARIASRYVKYFDVKQDIFKIINGAIKPTSAFGSPLLDLTKTTFKCDVAKIDHLSNCILKLAFKAQQVILAHEKLIGSKHSIVQSMDDWLKAIYQLRDSRNKARESCFKAIKGYIINDITDKKYQVGVSSNDEANKGLKKSLDSKYAWLGWVVYSYGAYGGDNHWVRNRYGKFWSMPENRQRNIIVGFVDKSGTYRNQKYAVLKAIDDIVRNVPFYSLRGDASKILPKFASELKKRDVWKYISVFNVLRKYKNLAVSGDNDLTYISEEYVLDANYKRKSKYDNTKSVKIRLMVILRSEEQAAEKKCKLSCNGHGECKILPYSSKERCLCKPYYEGVQCKDHSKVQLAKTMDAMLETTLKLPMLSDIQYSISDLREYVGVSLGKLQTAVSDLEVTFQKALNHLTEKVTKEFKWSNLITHYSASVRKISYYSYLFEKLPKIYGKKANEVGRKLAANVLAPDGIEKWLYEMNFLFLGRSGTPLVSHQPLMILFIDKYKDQSCSKRYKSSVDSAWTQLVLLQQVGFMLWSQALEFVGEKTNQVAALYKTRTAAQMKKLKSMTCEYEVANSKNVNCAGGAYLHTGMMIKVTCQPNFYLVGSALTTCKSKASSCKPCSCNSLGSKSLQCKDGTGICSCKPGYFGNKCQNHNCVWRWGSYSSCSRYCGYGGTQTRRKIVTVPRLGVGKSCQHPYSQSKSCFLSCCSNQFHCSARRTCISGSLKCNYKNDCGDGTDERHCRERCSTHHTTWNTEGNGQSYYLDRHRMNCGSSGHVLNMFKLERNGRGLIRYTYICCKLLSHPPICYNRVKNNPFTYDGRGDTVYLDRQAVSCPGNSFLNGLVLNRNMYRSQLRYSYSCCHLKVGYRESCHWRSTNYTYDGNGKSYYLDRQRVQCPTRYFIKYFRLARNSNHRKWKYVFLCCKVV